MKQILGAPSSTNYMDVRRNDPPYMHHLKAQHVPFVLLWQKEASSSDQECSVIGLNQLISMKGSRGGLAL